MTMLDPIKLIDSKIDEVRDVECKYTLEQSDGRVDVTLINCPEESLAVRILLSVECYLEDGELAFQNSFRFNSCENLYNFWEKREVECDPRYILFRATKDILNDYSQNESLKHKALLVLRAAMGHLYESSACTISELYREIERQNESSNLF